MIDYIITWEYILLFFMAGFIGDLIVHWAAHYLKIGTSLLPYYKSFRTVGPQFLEPRVKSILYGAIWGGIAVLFGLFLVNFWIYIINTFMQ